MRRRRERPTPSPANLHRAPIITERLIIRETTRTDARALEETMERAGLEEGERTSDGARRFGDGLAQVPVWSATRAVCEKGSAKIIGGVVISDVDDSTAVTKRVGWWLSGDSDRYAIEVLTAVGERLKSMGVAVVVLHVRIADRLSLQVANEAGYRRTNALQHLSVTGEPIDFWAYAHP